MDYIKPTDVLDQMIRSGIAKAALGPKDLLIRGGLSGALLGFATSLALTAALQTGKPIMGAIGPDALSAKIVSIAEAKTIGYAKFGFALDSPELAKEPA